MDVLRYYFAVIAQLVGLGGIYAGGGWAWAGVAQLPLFAVIDPLLGDDLRERKVGISDALMDVPVVLSSLLGPLTLIVLAWKVGHGGLSAVTTLGMIASGAWLALIPVVPAVHELYHKRSPWKYLLGTYAQFPYMDCTRSVAHTMSHHLHVGTPKDADTPLRGENMYTFIVRTIPGNYRELYEIEKVALAKRGLSVWSWQGKFVKAIAAYLALASSSLSVAGQVRWRASCRRSSLAFGSRRSTSCSTAGSSECPGSRSRHVMCGTIWGRSRASPPTRSPTTASTTSTLTSRTTRCAPTPTGQGCRTRFSASSSRSSRRSGIA